MAAERAAAHAVQRQIRKRSESSAARDKCVTPIYLFLIYLRRRAT